VALLPLRSYVVLILFRFQPLLWHRSWADLFKFIFTLSIRFANALYNVDGFSVYYLNDPFSMFIGLCIIFLGWFFSWWQNWDKPSSWEEPDRCFLPTSVCAYRHRHIRYITREGTGIRVCRGY
jgi:hypothetical protein